MGVLAYHPQYSGDAFLSILMRICELNARGYLTCLARNGFRS
jgi:hypothetical protein